MKRQILILCCATLVLAGCQKADENYGNGSTVTEPSGAERPMRGMTNGSFETNSEPQTNAIPSQP